MHINLQVRSPNALLQGVLNNELDLAVGTFSLQANSVVSHPLYREQNWLYCGNKHSLFTVKHPTEALISEMRMVTRSYWSSSDLGRKGFKQSVASAESMEHYALPWVQSQKLRALLPTEYGYQAPFSLIFRRGRSKETLIRSMRDAVRAGVKSRKN